MIDCEHVTHVYVQKAIFTAVSSVAMSLLRYFEPINRLPTPKEAGLSASTP